MSDYTKDARWGGKMLQSIFSVILAFAMAFAFSGLSATQLAYADEYSIEYKLAGGKLPDGSNNPLKYTDEDGDITLVNPIRNGYDFAGWTGTDLDADAATKTVTIPANSTGNREYTATWTPIDYSITYTLGDNAVAGTPANPDTYTIESDAITLSNPTRTGYVFAGWIGPELSGATMAATIKKGSTGNREYTATWTQTYTVTFDTDGGSTVASQEVAENGKATQPANPTKTGYKFDGWTLDGESYDFNTPVTGPITLTAKWVENEETYTVTYDLAGGTSAAEKLTFSDLEEGANTPTIANPTREGYTFKGWNPEIAATVTANVTYTAQWTARAGNWIKERGRWWYKYSDGTYPANCWLAVDGKYYHFDSKGWMQLGWLEIDTNVENQKLESKAWYFLNPSGAMATGWKKVSGRWYYMLTANDPQNSDGMNQTGVMVANTTKNIEGDIYSFAKSGAMITGWQSTKADNGEVWSYYSPSTGVQTTNNWVKSVGKWYWLGEDGTMATSSWVDGDNYYVNAKGVMLTGWQKISGIWYHLKFSGKKTVSNWIKSDGKWYWLNSGGSMATNAWVDNGNYYVNSDGVMLTGWQRIGTNSLGEPTLDSMGDYAYYYFASTGKKIANGWKKSGGNWYWLGENGTMAEDSWVAGGDYYVGAKGIMVTGTERIQYDSKGTETLDKQGRWATYYFNDTGKLAINQWVKMGGKWYWFGENGYMVQGSWVDGNKYYVNDEGVYIPNYKEDPTADNGN